MSMCTFKTHTHRVKMTKYFKYFHALFQLSEYLLMEAFTNIFHKTSWLIK